MKPLDCVGIDPARSEVGKHDFRQRDLPPLKPLSHEDVAGALLDQSISLADELAAVTRERDALKAAMDFMARNDGSDLAPAHREIVKKARETLAKLASGQLRKPGA